MYCLKIEKEPSPLLIMFSSITPYVAPCTDASYIISGADEKSDRIIRSCFINNFTFNAILEGNSVKAVLTSCNFFDCSPFSPRQYFLKAKLVE